MAIMTLHATCSTTLCNVQSILDSMDTSDLKTICLPLIKNPVYKKRMAGVCNDLVRLGYL